MPGLLPLENAVMEYSWGSRTAIPELLGRENRDARPQAELWMGAHPKAPSRILADPPGGTLDLLIRDHATECLGERVAARFGQLPFLLKVLAAAEPLSLQCHPNAAQALEGFARENARGIAWDAPERNYRDAAHKPEMIAALTTLWVLVGFRPPAEIATALRDLGVVALEPEMRALEAVRGGGQERTLREFLSSVLSLAEPRREQALAQARAGAIRKAGDPGARWIVRLGESYPGDCGVLAPAFLRLLRLAPGEAVFLEAGLLHAYLEGVGLELMANSDNVLRAGLTPKHVDKVELLRVARFDPSPPRILRAESLGSGCSAYRTPAEEFELLRLDAAAGAPLEVDGKRGPGILLCLEGEATLIASDQSLVVARGGSVFVPAACGPCRVEGTARLAFARVPPTTR